MILDLAYTLEVPKLFMKGKGIKQKKILAAFSRRRHSIENFEPAVGWPENRTGHVLPLRVDARYRHHGFQLPDTGRVLGVS